MAKNSSNKSKNDDLHETVKKLIDDVSEDREMLVDFTKDLINNFTGEQAVGIAEYVSKLADALTRQNQVRVAALKAAEKVLNQESDDDANSIHDSIGLPFEDHEEGSN